MSKGKAVVGCIAAAFAIAVGFRLVDDRIESKRGVELVEAGKIVFAAKQQAERLGLERDKAEAIAKLTSEKVDAIVKVDGYISIGRSQKALELLEPFAELNDSAVSEALVRAKLGLRADSIAQAKSLLRFGNPRAAERVIMPYVGPHASPEIPELYTRIAEVIVKEDAESISRKAVEKKKRGVDIGMTQEEVVMSSWGKPQKVNRTVTAHGVREQWVYGGGYLYFDDGKLSAIQN